MHRANAIGYLLDRRRKLVEKMGASKLSDTEIKGDKDVAQLDRLVLEVRAGRVREFRFDEPESVEIIVTMD